MLLFATSGITVIRSVPVSIAASGASPCAGKRGPMTAGVELAPLPAAPAAPLPAAARPALPLAAGAPAAPFAGTFVVGGAVVAPPAQSASSTEYVVSAAIFSPGTSTWNVLAVSASAEALLTRCF